MSDSKTTTGPTVGVVAESGPDERRVALVPKAVSTLVNSGLAVVVESGAGERALLPDELYTAAGATIGDALGTATIIEMARTLRVLAVNGDPRTTRNEDETFFFETALRSGVPEQA